MKMLQNVNGDKRRRHRQQRQR